MSGSTPPAGGQTPPADDSATRQTPPTSGQTPTTPQGNDDDQPMSVAEARKLREESKQRRLALEATQAELKKIQDAQLSETEKQSKRLAELQSKESSWAEERQRMLLERAVEREASATFIDPEDAMHYLDLAEVEYDDNGRPKNLAKVLKNLAADLKGRGKGHLLKSEQQQGGPPAPQGQPPRQSIGASNPGRSATSGQGQLSWEYLAKLTTTPEGRAEYEARSAEIRAWTSDPRNRRQLRSY